MPVIRTAAEQDADAKQEREAWIRAMLPVVKGNIVLALMDFERRRDSRVQGSADIAQSGAQISITTTRVR